MRSVLVDTGPLVALFDEDDEHHDRIRRWFEREAKKARLVTVDAVVTEALFLLDFDVGQQTDFLEWLDDGVVDVLHPARGAYAAVAQLMAKYADQRMEYADACLVWLANQIGTLDVLTIDRRDFTVYRNANRRSFRILPA